MTDHACPGFPACYACYMAWLSRSDWPAFRFDNPPARPAPEEQAMNEVSKGYQYANNPVLRTATEMDAVACGTEAPKLPAVHRALEDLRVALSDCHHAADTLIEGVDSVLSNPKPEPDNANQCGRPPAESQLAEFIVKQAESLGALYRKLRDARERLTL